MKKEKSGKSHGNIKMLRLMTVYAIISLIFLIYAIGFSDKQKSIFEEQTQEKEITAKTEYVYVAPDSKENTDIITESIDEEIYNVREYNDRIGIFYQDGTLKEIIEVYIKSLPEADRHLLREGIEVVGKKQLNSIIEDYTG